MCIDIIIQCVITLVCQGLAEVGDHTLTYLLAVLSLVESSVTRRCYFFSPQ